jgi:hypothetical protein
MKTDEGHTIKDARHSGDNDEERGRRGEGEKESQEGRRLSDLETKRLDFSPGEPAPLKREAT